MTTRSGGVGTSTVQFKSVIVVPGRLNKNMCALLSGLFSADCIIHRDGSRGRVQGVRIPP